MNKVTMQDIADALGISRVTVWKVFNNYANVSASLRESVLAKAKEMGYTKGIAEGEAAEPERNVSLIVSRPNSSTFWTKIVHGLARELAFHHINLIYTYMPSSYSDKFEMPSVLTGSTVQGMVIVNLYDERLTRLVNQLNIPKVFLDVVPQVSTHEIQGDVIILEGYRSVYEITESVLKKGLTKVGFMGDTRYAQTNYERYRGFRKCMKDYGLSVQGEICLTERIGIFEYSEAISSFLDSLPELPEAFVCASDFIAHFIQLYLAEHPERAPKGIVVTGYDGTHEYSNVDGLITTAKVRNGFLCKRLAQQIIYRMEYENAPHECIYISPSLIFRDSVLYGQTH